MSPHSPLFLLPLRTSPARVCAPHVRCRPLPRPTLRRTLVRASARSNCDGLLDVLAVRTLCQLGIAVSAHRALAGGISRVAQTDQVHVEFVESPATITVPLQVDGEAFMLVNPKSLTVTRGGSAQLLYGNR
jgi:hypothetical protein